MRLTRHSFITMALLLAAPVWAESPDDGWWTDYAAARQVAIEKKLPLVIYFTGSDWCVWCRKLDAGLFSAPEFHSAMEDQIVAVKLDFPKRRKIPVQTARQNRVLKDRFEVVSFPTVIWLEPDGEQVLKRHGYIDPN